MTTTEVAHNLVTMYLEQGYNETKSDEPTFRKFCRITSWGTKQCQYVVKVNEN